MEVVCLILGPMLASQPCSHASWGLTSLHLLSFLLKMFFYYSCFNNNCYYSNHTYHGYNILIASCDLIKIKTLVATEYRQFALSRTAGEI